MAVRKDNSEMNNGVVKFESFFVFISYLLFYVCMYYQEVEVFGQSSGEERLRRSAEEKRKKSWRSKEKRQSFVEVIWEEYSGKFFSSLV